MSGVWVFWALWIGSLLAYGAGVVLVLDRLAVAL